MSTINKIFYENGYCKVDGQNVTIGIKYISLPKMPNDIAQKFCKMSNCCPYLQEGKCDLENECEIFKNAKEIRNNY